MGGQCRAAHSSGGANSIGLSFLSPKPRGRGEWIWDYRVRDPSDLNIL